MGYNQKGPSRGEWVAVVAVFIVFAFACSALTELFNGDILASMIPEEPTGYEVAMQTVKESDPVFGPMATDAVGGIGFGLLLLPAIVFVVWVYYFFAKWHPQPTHK